MELSKVFSRLPPISLCFRRHYSVYGKEFQNPVYREDKQKKIFESGEVERLKHLPIKAAQTNESSSIFYDVLTAKFVNYIMESGKKKTAREELNKALAIIKKTQLERYHKAVTPEEKTKITTDPIRIMKQAITNCRPILKLTPIKRGGSTYQVPVPISDSESLFRAMRWIVISSREKEGPIPFAVKLAQELLDASENKGRVVKQKTDLHKTCEANRAYAHFRWT